MAYGGSYPTLNIRGYTDLIELELQQNGTRIRPFVTVEQGMGDRTYFNKLGALNDSYVRTGRLEDVQIGDQTFERRLVTPITIEQDQAISDLDIVRYSRSPQPEVAASMAMNLGRKMDTIIVNALAGTAAIETDGTISTVNFDTNFQIGVSDNAFASLPIIVTGKQIGRAHV